MTPALFMGIVFSAMGLIISLISSWIARVATSGNLFLKSGAEGEAYKAKKFKRVRTLGTGITVLGLGFLVLGFLTGQ